MGFSVWRWILCRYPRHTDLLCNDKQFAGLKTFHIKSVLVLSGQILPVSRAVPSNEGTISRWDIPFLPREQDFLLLRAAGFAP